MREFKKGLGVEIGGGGGVGLGGEVEFHHISVLCFFDLVGVFNVGGVDLLPKILPFIVKPFKNALNIALNTGIFDVFFLLFRIIQ